MRRLFGLSAVLFLAMGSVALASAPLREWTHIDNDIVLPGATAVCGFEIRGHFVGDSHFTLYYDNDGNIVKEIDTFPSLTVTVYRPGTDMSYTTVAPAVLLTYYTDNAAIGSAATAYLTGLLEHIPGIDMDSGRFAYNARVITIDSAGIPIIQFVSEISSAGPDLDRPIRFQRCAFFQ
jgi:hypothetical protein